LYKSPRKRGFIFGLNSRFRKSKFRENIQQGRQIRNAIYWQL